MQQLHIHLQIKAEKSKTFLKSSFTVTLHLAWSSFLTDAGCCCEIWSVVVKSTNNTSLLRCAFELATKIQCRCRHADEKQDKFVKKKLGQGEEGNHKLKKEMPLGLVNKNACMNTAGQLSDHNCLSYTKEKLIIIKQINTN